MLSLYTLYIRNIISFINIKRITMIQRIQTVFLFITAALCVALFFVNIAEFDVDGSAVTLSLSQYSDEAGKMIESTHIIYQQVILTALVALINLIAIFLYNNRILQMRVCIYSIILQVAILVMFAFYIWIGQSENGNEFLHFGIGSFIPLITIILTYLAFHSIKKDEKLVRSLDRIR